MGESMVYGQLVALQDGSRQFILLNAILNPVSSTVDTLRSQLLIITGLLVFLSLGLALILSRRVARPIVRINERSKELAKGNYEVSFSASGYKEIAELADTLNHAARELNKVETLRRELIANVSHDLRTPLTMISGYAEVMRDLPGENNPENIQVIIDEARRLTGLVNDLLDLSRLQAGSQNLNKSTYSLTASIRTIISRYGKLIDQEGYDLSFEAAEDARVHADELRIDQVLYNLINNAISYTGDDRKVTVRQTVAGGRVRIEIIDSGDGVPPSSCRTSGIVTTKATRRTGGRWSAPVSGFRLSRARWSCTRLNSVWTAIPPPAASFGLSCPWLRIDGSFQPPATRSSWSSCALISFRARSWPAFNCCQRPSALLSRSSYRDSSWLARAGATLASPEPASSSITGTASLDSWLKCAVSSRPVAW